jgi:hypothetical protein
MIRQADSPDVTRRIQELRYEALRRGQDCYRHVDKSMRDCWCCGRGIGGVTLPCPLRDQTLPAATEAIPL